MKQCFLSLRVSFKLLCGWMSLSFFVFLFCLGLCNRLRWRKGTWGRGSHTGSFWGAVPLSWSLIRWAHTQHVPLVSSAWLVLPPEIKDGWGAAVLMERRGGYKVVGGNGWGVGIWLWGKGRSGDILKPLCACVGESHHPPPLPPSDTDLFVGFILKTPALWRWPPETNPVTSSALKWPLVDVARTVCHFGLHSGGVCVWSIFVCEWVQGGVWGQLVMEVGYCVQHRAHSRTIVVEVWC